MFEYMREKDKFLEEEEEKMILRISLTFHAPEGLTIILPIFPYYVI